MASRPYYLDEGYDRILYMGAHGLSLLKDVSLSIYLFTVVPQPLLYRARGLTMVRIEGKL
jgi:hypothetical protein